MSKKNWGAVVFAAYILTVIIAYFVGNDRLVILVAAIMSGFAFVFRILYVEESEQIIRFFDKRITETIETFQRSIKEVHERIDKHHPPHE